jgi:hypothetical protein
MMEGMSKYNWLIHKTAIVYCWSGQFELDSSPKNRSWLKFIKTFGVEVDQLGSAFEPFIREHKTVYTVGQQILRVLVLAELCIIQGGQNKRYALNKFRLVSQDKKF